MKPFNDAGMISAKAIFFWWVDLWRGFHHLGLKPGLRS
jgi:hypothetical protein